MVAFSSAAQIGYIYMGLGLGTQAALLAVFFQIFAHALTKPMLFLSSAGLIAGMYANMGLRENKRMYADDFYSIALIINTGIAFSIMPASVACWGIDGVVFRPVQGFKAKARTLLVYPRGSQDTGIRSFVSLIKPKR